MSDFYIKIYREKLANVDFFFTFAKNINFDEKNIVCVINFDSFLLSGTRWKLYQYIRVDRNCVEANKYYDRERNKYDGVPA